MTSTTSRDRVLVVEDDPATRLGLTELERTWGSVTEAAADGEEALQRITAFRPSIIISDLVMRAWAVLSFCGRSKARAAI